MEADAPDLLLILLRSNPANVVVRFHRAPAAAALSVPTVVTRDEQPCAGADAGRREAAEEDDDDEGLTRRGQGAAAR